MSERDAADRTWYSGVTRYQWLVLVIASAGWMFDAFEGQVFNITRGQMLADLMGSESSTERVRMWGDTFLAIFLLGGTVGGLAFGSLADRYGRKPTMALTILFYSIFSGLTYFRDRAVARRGAAVPRGARRRRRMGSGSDACRRSLSGARPRTSIGNLPCDERPWNVAGGGGRPRRRQPMALRLHYWSAAGAAGVVGAQQHPRAGTMVRRRRASERSGEGRRGSFSELFGVARWARPAILGLLLAAVGLGTFWGVTVAGQDLTQALLMRNGMPQALAAERAKFAFGIVQTAGGGLGLLCFGPLAEWIGGEARSR